MFLFIPVSVTEGMLYSIHWYNLELKQEFSSFSRDCHCNQLAPKNVQILWNYFSFRKIHHWDSWQIHKATRNGPLLITLPCSKPQGKRIRNFSIWLDIFLVNKNLELWGVLGFLFCCCCCCSMYMSFKSFKAKEFLCQISVRTDYFMSNL